MFPDKLSNFLLKSIICFTQSLPKMHKYWGLAGKTITINGRILKSIYRLNQILPHTTPQQPTPQETDQSVPTGWKLPLAEALIISLGLIGPGLSWCKHKLSSSWQRSRNPTEGIIPGGHLGGSNHWGDLKCILREIQEYALGSWGRIGEGWMEERKRESAALLLTYICLFVVLDEFSELKVPSNNSHLERNRERREKEWGEKN